MASPRIINTMLSIDLSPLLCYNKFKNMKRDVYAMKIVSNFSIIVSLVFLAIIFIEMLVKLGESCFRKRENAKIVKGLSLSSKRKIFLTKIHNREEVCYRTYLLYNALYFIGSFLSLEYSVATMATLLISNNDVFSQIWMPLITMTFTIVNICVKPQQRANQYLLAWRKYDAHTQLLLQKNYEKMTEDEIYSEFQESILFQKKIEDSLEHDEIKDC